MSRRAILAALVLSAAFLSLCLPASAFAYRETGPDYPVSGTCVGCHHGWAESECTADGNIDGTFVANPRFQNFPHETENANLLLETGDDLCLNCHPTGQLP